MMTVFSRSPLGLVLLAAWPSAAQAADPLSIGQTPSASTAVDAATLDAITVTASGQTRQVQRLSATEIRKQPAGTNPLKMLEKLPGVHFVASDPFGTYEWSHRISIRGFEQRQLGYILDGIPLGDAGYTAHNGLTPNRAAIAENLAQLELAQGAGALRIPSTSNLGGALVLYSADPARDFGGRAVLALGSDSLRRGYARLDSGDVGGFSGYVSAMDSQVDKWKGDGVQEHRQYNAKLLYAWDRGRVSLWLNHSDRIEDDYQDLSLALLERCGYDWDNYSPDWNRALEAARGVFTGCVQTRDDAYFDARGLREDGLVGLSADVMLGETLSLSSTAYYHHTEGEGHWFTPFIASPTVPIALRVTRYGLERSGLNARLIHEGERHTLEGGVWIEDSRHRVGRSFVHLDGPIDDRRYFSDFDGHLFRQRFDTTTRQWYLQDALRLVDDRLTLTAGFKGQGIETDATVIIPGRAGGRLSAEDRFLPQVGAAWKLDERSDVFANYAENQAAFRPGVSGAWSLGQASFDASQAGAQPETSRTLEVGYRLGTEAFQFSAAVYGVRFDDRQLVIVPCAGIVSCANQFANVGSVTTRGAELALILTPGDDWRWFNSVTWNDSQYDDDYLNRSYNDPSTDCRVPTAPSCSHLVRAGGKQVVDVPKQMFASEIEVRFADDFHAKLGTKYTGERFYTYNNDARVDGFWLWNAGLAWELGEAVGWDDARLALDVTNLFEERYIATLGSNGFRDSDPDGTFQTLLAGAPRQVFLSLDVRF